MSLSRELTREEKFAQKVAAFIRGMELAPLDGLAMEHDHIAMIHNSAVATILSVVLDPQDNGELIAAAKEYATETNLAKALGEV